MTTTVLLLVGVFFLGMGLYGLVMPAALIRPFGIELPGPVARTEVRAVYGGFGVAVAGLLGYAAVAGGPARPGITVAVAVALFGMAFGRLVARFVERPGAFYPSWLYFWIELVAGAALLAVA